MQKVAAVRARDRLIGEGYPSFIVAEIGINHNGDARLARKMVDAAAEAGADAVKFQNYRTEDFLLDKTLSYGYISRKKKRVENQYQMFKRHELSFADLKELSELCRRREIIFFSTPTSQEGVKEIVRLGAPLVKNASDGLTNFPLIRAMARSGIPTVMSTGMATVSEIAEAVAEFREAGGKALILMHCVSLYPAKFGDLNLRKIQTLGATFGCPVGFSDHSQGTVAAIGAVTLGACVLEKHFTLDRNLPGPDHAFSATPAEMKYLVESVRNLELSLGKNALGHVEAEVEARRTSRLSCVAARSMSAGYRLSSEDIAFSRPGSGFPPKMTGLFVGRKLAKDIQRGHILTLDDILGQGQTR